MGKRVCSRREPALAKAYVCAAVKNSCNSNEVHSQISSHISCEEAPKLFVHKPDAQSHSGDSRHCPFGPSRASISETQSTRSSNLLDSGLSSAQHLAFPAAGTFQTFHLKANLGKLMPNRRFHAVASKCAADFQRVKSRLKDGPRP